MDERRPRAQGDPAHLPGVRALTDAVRARVVRQDGVATTADLSLGGVSAGRVARRVRDGEWQRLFRGVVVLQSGPPTWRQRARAALLAAGSGAALSHASAGYLHGILAGPGTSVVVSIPAGRTVRRQPGLVVHRRRRMPFAGGGLRAIEAHATLVDLVETAPDRDTAVALVCDATRAGLHPERVLHELTQRPRVAFRRLVQELLGGVDDGVESALEHRYLREVERRHGLPVSVGQVRQVVEGRWIRADRVHPGLGVRIELDGQLAHPFGRTDRDVWRDNAVIIDHGDLTLRYRWRHVATQPCTTAAQVARALTRSGWSGAPTRCSPTCSAPG